MTTSERMAQVRVIERCSIILEGMNNRLRAPKRGWEKAQTEDWMALRTLCNGEVARAALVPPKPEHEDSAAVNRLLQDGKQ